MFRKRNLAGAAVAAAIASAALAGPAAAAPIDPVTIDTPGHTFQFGNGCAVGAAPATNGNVDWRYNPAGTNSAPQISGTLCLQGTNALARMAVTYHDANHNVITRFASNPAQGNGSPLNTFAVNAGGSRVSLQVLDHLLVDVERDVAGTWQVVPGGRVVLP